MHKVILSLFILYLVFAPDSNPIRLFSLDLLVYTGHLFIKAIFTIKPNEDLKYQDQITVKILKFGTPETIAIIVLKLVKFDVTLH